MKFSLEAGAMHAAVIAASRPTENRVTIPILAHLHIDADTAGIVVLRGTNLDIEISVRVGAEVEQAGVTTLPAKILGDIVKKFSKHSTVVLEKVKGKDTVTVRCGRSRFVLQTLPADDYPKLQPDETGHRFVMPARDLKKLFETTQFAISTEETRYYLNGVYLHAVGNMLRATTTDGHKLACADVALPVGADGMPGIIVQKNAVANVIKTLDGYDEADLSISAGRFGFVAGDVTMIARNIDGTFPDYMRVVPTGNDKSAVLDRELMVGVADRVSTIRSERGPAVKLDFVGSTLKCSVTNPDTGSAEEEIEIVYQSDPLTIGFNSRYLTDILEHVDTNKVEIKLADAGSPTLFKPVGDESTFFVLMPMRT